MVSKAGGAFSIVSPFQTRTRSAWEAPAPRPSLPRELGRRYSRTRDFLFSNSSPFAYAYTYPSGYDASMFYPSLWPPLDQQYLQAREIANGDVAGEAIAQENDLLSRQVQALTSEIESLRQGAAPQAPAARAPAATQPRSLPTVFVYRDGRSLEVRNYAIFNQTLWVFGAETTQRIPLSEIDLPATLKLNEQRGVDVSLPNAQ